MLYDSVSGAHTRVGDMDSVNPVSIIIIIIIMTFIKRHLSWQPIPRRCTNKILKKNNMNKPETDKSQLVNNTIYGTSCEIKEWNIMWITSCGK